MTSACTALAIGICVGALLIVWWDSYALLSVLTGVALGWATGILLAPYDTEKKKFSNWSKTLLGFLGGYGVTKVEGYLDSLSVQNKQALFDATVAKRFWVGLLAFLVTSIVVFVFRNYYETVSVPEKQLSRANTG